MPAKAPLMRLPPPNHSEFLRLFQLRPFSVSLVRHSIMAYRVILALLVSAAAVFGAEPASLNLPDSNILLRIPDGWTVKERNGEMGIYSADQPSKGPPSRIHFSRSKEAATDLQGAIDSEIERISELSPKWGSSNDRQSYKGSVHVKTDSGLTGLRADFYYDEPRGRRYTIVKYYFFDEAGKIFRVCAHVGGGEVRFKAYEQTVLRGLSFIKKN